MDSRTIGNWLQFTILLVTIIVLAMHGEGRLARIEQAQQDEATARAELKVQFDHLEQRLDYLRK